MAKVKIGVLSLQGSVVEHERSLWRAGAESVRVNDKEELSRVDGIILPGGESTTLGKLLKLFDMHNLLKRRIEDGMPVFGTCAGLILLANEIEGEEAHLGVMNISVKRNAYGRQIDSFSTEGVIEEVSDNPIEMVFIRAPIIERVYGEAKVLCRVDGRIVAARERNMLVTSFHPELTNDTTLHKYFIDMVNKSKE